MTLHVLHSQFYECNSGWKKSRLKNENSIATIVGNFNRCRMLVANTVTFYDGAIKKNYKKKRMCKRQDECNRIL